MKKILLPLFIFIVFITNAQVGIGTTSPSGLLDITASSASSPTTTDGLLIPRVLAFPSPVGIAQNGMMVFLTTAFSGNKVGLYYYDFPSLTWKWMASGNNGNVWAFNNTNSRIEIPFQSDGTTSRPVGNEVYILDNGKVGFGISPTSRQFHINRDINEGTKFAVSNTNTGNAAFSQITAEAKGNTAYMYSINDTYPFDPLYPWFRSANTLFQSTGFGGLSLAATSNLGYINFFTGGNDESMRITPTGNVGIGKKVPVSKLDVVGDTNVTAGYFYGGISSPANLEIIRTMPTVVNNTVEIGNFNITHGSHNFRLTATVSLNQFSVSKSYIVSTSYNQTSNIWQLLSPITNTGIYVLDDFDIDINVNNNITSLRIRRKSGSIAGNISIRIENTGTTTDVFTPTFATAAVTAPTVLFNPNTSPTSWNITGNASTVDGTNFIGTTDNIPVNFRMNNQKSGRISSNGETFFGFEAGKNNPITGNATTNSAFGYRSFTSNTSSTARDNVAIGLSALTLNNGGSYNTALGSGALKSNVGTSYNTALGKDALSANIADYNTSVGWESLVSNTTGARNIGIGIRPLRYYTTISDNIAIGYEALVGNVTTASNTGTNNTAIGNFSMTANTSGTENVTLGNDALRANTTGNQNTAIGYQALLVNTTGSENTSIGRKSMPNNTSGSANTAVGFNALFLNNGNNNTGIGRNALFFNSTGSNNSALGWNAMFTNKTGASNTALGYGSLYTNDNGNNNVAIGDRSLYNNISGSGNVANGFNALFNNTASSNSAIGNQAMYSNTSGTFNSALGTNTLYTNTTGDYNVAIGNNTMNLNLTGSSNTAVGYSALTNNSVGINNTAIGRNALNSNIASNNTAIGHTASYLNTTGTGNVAVGYQALYTNTIGTNNTALGINAIQTGTGSNNTAIGSNVLALATSGSQNTAVGENALSKSSSGSANDAFGHRTLWNVTSGSFNTGFGSTALSIVTTGGGNSAIGNSAGSLITTGSNNIAIGKASQVPSATGDDQMSIGNVIYGTTMSTTALGKIGIGVSNPGTRFQVGPDHTLPNVGGLVQVNLNDADSQVQGLKVSVKKTTGTNYAVNGTAFGTGANTNIGLYGYALGATANNWGLYLEEGDAYIKGKTGIGTFAPTEKLDVVGNIKLSGALMPNNIAGTNGQVLISSGVGVAPTWDSNPAKPIFKTTATGVYNVTAANYTVRVNVGTATGINLPAASTNTGKIFVIIGFDGLATIPFSTSGGSIIDEALGITITTLNGNDRYTLQSDGTNWVVIGR